MAARSEFEPILPSRQPDRIERGVNWLLMGVAVLAAFLLIVFGMLGSDRFARSTQVDDETVPRVAPIDVGSLPD